MNDKELADKVVALGVGSHSSYLYFAIDDADGMTSGHLFAEQFVRDWRVAGALMEKVLGTAKDRRGAWDKINPQGGWSFLTKPISTPRAIIEACVDALSEHTK